MVRFLNDVIYSCKITSVKDKAGLENVSLKEAQILSKLVTRVQIYKEN